MYARTFCGRKKTSQGEVVQERTILTAPLSRKRRLVRAPIVGGKNASFVSFTITSEGFYKPLDDTLTQFQSLVILFLIRK